MRKLLCSVLVLALVFSSAFSTIVFAGSGVNAGVIGGVVSGGVIGGETGGGAVGGGGNFEIGEDTTEPEKPTSGDCGDFAEYVLGDDGTLTISGTGVVEAGFFYEDFRIKNVVIEEGITEIGVRAFAYCDYIKSVSFPSTLRIISECAFVASKRLGSVTIQSTVATIEENAFSGSAAPVIIGTKGSEAERFATDAGILFAENGKTIVNGTVTDTISWTLDLLTNTITLTGTGEMPAFQEYSNKAPWCDYKQYIRRVVIGDGITNVGQNSFYEYNNIDSVTIGKNVKTIGMHAFSGCEFIESLEIPSNVKSIERYAFVNCTDLETVTFSEGIETIEQNAFSGCAKIEEAILPDTLRTLGTDVFSNVGLKTVHIGKNLTDVSSTTFGMNVEKITVSSENPTLSVKDGVLFNDVQKTLLLCPRTKSGSYAIPDGTEIIAHSAFRVCKLLTEVKIPKSVKTINHYSFTGCEALARVELNEGLRTIGYSAFGGCKSLAEIEVPVSAAYFDEYIFDEEILIKGYSVTRIEEYADENGYNFKSLGDVYVESVRVTTSDELLAAMETQEHKKIILADGVYNLNYSLKIMNAYDLTIVAENPGKAELLLSDGYAPVIQIEDSIRVNIIGLIAGHYSLEYNGGCGSGAFSAGYVVQISRSERINFDYCDLYGCGTMGFYCSETDSLRVTNCVIRDCSESIAEFYNYTYDEYSVSFDSCVISSNAYLESFATSKPAIYAEGTTVNFTDCTFVNNKSTTRENDTNLVSYTNCIFQNNVWDDETPENYGVTLNNITWQIKKAANGETTLKIGYPVSFSDGTSLSSEKGTILSYTESSIPWKGCEYDAVDCAEGVVYNPENYGDDNGESGGTTPTGPTIGWNSLTIESGVMEILFGMNNITESFSIIASVADSNGNLLATGTAVVNPGDVEKKVKITIGEMGNNYKLNIFYWNSLSGIMPLFSNEFLVMRN